MKVTKEMLHPDLQSRYGVLSMMTSLSKRQWFRRFTDRVSGALLRGRDVKGLDCDEHQVISSDGGYLVRTRVYRPAGEHGKLPVMLYIHGGGYIAGCPEAMGAEFERFIKTRPCVIVAPDYRKAYTRPFPAGFNDCYDTLLWIKERAEELGVISDKIMIAGHSAGGGLTAAVTLKARDTGDVSVAFQMPIYPMIDDSQPDDPTRVIETPVWDTDMNRIGWGAYLSDLRRDGTEIPAYAAPARNRDYSGFPPTVTFVGTLEPFYQETVEYVKALEEAGVEVAFREYEGCFHAFDFMGQGISEDAKAFTFDQYAAFYDRCFSPNQLPAG